MRVVRRQSVEAALMTVLLVSYFVAPSRIPGIGVTVHGIMLLVAAVYYAAADRAFRWRVHWPFAAFIASIASSWVWTGGDADTGVTRAIGFGVLAAFFFGRYLQGEYVVRALRFLAWPVVATAIVMICLYLAALFGAAVTTFDLFEWAGQSSYHSGMFSLFALPIVWHASTEKNKRLALLWLLPLWMVIFMSGLRGLWIGAVVAMLVFGIAARRWFQTVEAFAVTIVAFGIVTVVTNLYLARVPVFAGQLESSSTQVAAANLRAKTSVKSGGDKFLEELTSSGRVGYWVAGIAMWASSPAFGVGPGNFAKNSAVFSVAGADRRDAEDQFDAHNIFISVLAELGLVGFSSMMALLLVPVLRWLRLWRSAPFNRDSLALVAALFAGLTAVGLTWDMHIQRLWWISVGLLWGATVAPDAGEWSQGKRVI